MTTPAAKAATLEFKLPPPAVTRVIAIALQKGGVGKTATAVNLGAALALGGLRVLVIDLDPQGNATSGLGVTVDPDDATMYEALHYDRDERVPLVEVIKPGPYGVDVAPAGGRAHARLDREGLGTGGEIRFRKQVGSIEGYHYILLDLPPSLGSMTVAGLSAADDVLVAMKPGPDEVEGLVELNKTIADVQDSFNDDLEIGYMLATDYDGRTQVAKDIRNLLIRDWGEWDEGGMYVGAISHTVRVPEAKQKKMPVHVHAPDCTAVEDYISVAKRIAERLAEGKATA
ncbi:ParA family protein [Nocardia sp. NPDC059239]|uniref:ParA family protein n=1 Tax=Nocardia sp. NPDC059239 TaxID=3346785 RepID=UPI00368223AC